jgi:hypothetical protein
MPLSFAKRLVVDLRPALQPSGVVTVIADGFGGATLQRFVGLFPFLVSDRLVKDDA